MSEAAKKELKMLVERPLIFEIPDTLTNADLDAMSAHPRPDYPISSNDTLTEDDALMFRIPARFGILSCTVQGFSWTLPVLDGPLVPYSVNRW